MLFYRKTKTQKKQKGDLMPKLTEYEQHVADKVKEALPYMNEKQKSYLLGAGEIIILQHKPDPDKETEDKPA